MSYMYRYNYTVAALHACPKPQSLSVRRSDVPGAALRSQSVPLGPFLVLLRVRTPVAPGIIMRTALGATLLFLAPTAGVQNTAAPTSAQCEAVPNASRLPCGIYETRADNMHGGYDFGAACHARGCCYLALPASGAASALTSPNCYWPGAAVPIKTAHLVQSNHLDLGFTDQLDAVVNSYFDVFFPGAVALAAELRSRGGEERLRWMTQSWLVFNFPIPGHFIENAITMWNSP